MTRTELKTIFTEAWSIAYRAAKKFGYRVSRFFAEALRQAYKMGVAAIRANNLRSSLNCAARTAYTNGATEKQVNFIVALAVKLNDFNILSGGRLTKFEASQIIDTMKRDADRLAA